MSQLIWLIMSLMRHEKKVLKRFDFLMSKSTISIYLVKDFMTILIYCRSALIRLFLPFFIETFL